MDKRNTGIAGPPASAVNPGTRRGGRLAGRSAVVTGGATGLGAAIAQRYLAEGARVAVVDLASADQSAGEPVAVARNFTADVTRKEDVIRVFGEIEAQFGIPDILVNNVGGGGSPAQLLVDLEEKHWDGSLASNLKSAFLCTQAFARQRIDAGGGGAVINMSSLSGKVGTPLLGIYAVGKAGVIRLTDVFARELAEHGIRVNSICPSVVATPLAERMFRKHPEIFERAFDLQGEGEVRDRLARKVPLGRLGTPQDVASLALFLASDEAAYICGQAINCNGGLITH